MARYVASDQALRKKLMRGSRPPDDVNAGSVFQPWIPARFMVYAIFITRPIAAVMRSHSLASTARRRRPEAVSR